MKVNEVSVSVSVFNTTQHVSVIRHVFNMKCRCYIEYYYIKYTLNMGVIGLPAGILVL